MATSKKSIHYASLVIESRGFADDVRSSQSQLEWSKLFSAGEYYIDLSLRSEGDGFALKGQVLAVDSSRALPKGRAALTLASKAKVSEALNASGAFSLELDEADFSDLEITLSEAILRVAMTESDAS